VISRKFSPTIWQTLAISVALAVPSTLTIAAEHPEIKPQNGWKPLFNGKDLSNWDVVTQDGEPANADAWVVEHNTLTRKGRAYLRSKAATKTSSWTWNSRLDNLTATGEPTAGSSSATTHARNWSRPRRNTGGTDFWKSNSSTPTVSNPTNISAVPSTT